MTLGITDDHVSDNQPMGCGAELAQIGRGIVWVQGEECAGKYLGYYLGAVLGCPDPRVALQFCMYMYNG